MKLFTIILVLVLLAPTIGLAEDLKFTWSYNVTGIPADTDGGFTVFQHDIEVCRWDGITLTSGVCAVDPMAAVTDWDIRAFVVYNGVEYISFPSSKHVLIKAVPSWTMEVLP